jgi:IPT/TIG domain/Putative Ig domain/Right handed beta helix region
MIAALVFVALTGCAGVPVAPSSNSHGTPISAALRITTSGLPSGSVGSGYSATLTAIGGTPPYTWNTASGRLPAGLQLGAGSGTIQGTPSEAGNAPFTAQVVDAKAAVASTSLALSIVPAPAPTISGVSPTSGPMSGGTAVTISGSNFRSVTGVQFGGVAATAVQVASGEQIRAVTPSEPSGTVSIAVQSSDGQISTDAKAFIFTSAPLQITTASLPAGSEGTSYSAALAASGGTPPYTWSTSKGSLPAGLQLSASAGTISGKPTQTGSFAFTAKVQDAKSESSSVNVSISVADSAEPPPVTVSAQSTTYYIDSVGGNDNNNGASPSTPWQTIAKVNSSQFSPGNQILFKSGDTWREQLSITSSGTASSPLVFGSYGSGAAPVISGADLATGWTSSSSTGTIWKMNISNPTNQVFEDGTRLTSSPSLSAMPAGSFYFDSGGNSVYVRTLADDNPTNHMMEISSRNYGIYEAGGAKYITLQNLQTSDASSTDIYFNGSAFITISNVSAINSFGEGLRFDVVANSTIVSSTAAYNGSNGFSADDSPNLVINSCVAHDNAALASVDYTAGIKINPDYAPYASSTGVTIENSESYRNGVGQPGWRGAGIWADTIGSRLLVQYNLVYENNIEGIYFDAISNETAAYNVVFGNGQSGAIDGSGIAVYGDGRVVAGDSLYGNTVYGNRTAGINVSGAGLTQGCQNIVVQNNIAVGTIAGPNFLAAGGCENSSPYGSGNVYTHNSFGPQSSKFIQYGANNYVSSYTSFNAAYGTNTYSVQGDPVFSNPGAYDFALQSASPAIGTGLNLGPTYGLALAASSVWPSAVVKLSQTSSGPWDVGAYMYSQSSSPSGSTEVDRRVASTVQ